MTGTAWTGEARARFDAYVEWLKAFCRIQSISATGEGIGGAVDHLAARIKDLGGEVEVLRLEGANPAVLATFSPDGATARAGARKTLLFYDHYDVQPADPLDEWTGDPFEPQVRNGKFYARGAADNKGDLISRLAAVDLVRRRGGLPCTVKFFIEGEEEIGSPSLERYVERYREKLAADACIWETGSRDPGERIHLFLGLKGIAYLELSVRTASVDLHSSYGAIVDAASNRLVRALATLRNSLGEIQIPGFYDEVIPPGPDVRRAVEQIPFETEAYRKTFGVAGFTRGREGAAALAALLLEPSCTICGIESGYTGEGAKTVLPREAVAKVDFRLVPNQSPDHVVERLRHHLDMHGYGDVEVKVLAGERPYRTNLSDPFVEIVRSVAEEATGRRVCVYPNHYGSGPMYPIGSTLGVPIVSVGTAYWDSRPHAPDENIRLSDFQETIALMAALIDRFGRA